jgi:GNAT superfamily N-acetyltransferase
VGSLERIRRFLRETDEKVCDERRLTRSGLALITPSLPLVWQLNAIRIDDPQAEPAAVEAEAEELLAGFAHRKLVAHHEDLGARLTPALTARGWNATRLLVMVRRRPPDRPPEPGLGAEVSRERGAAVLAAFRREQPFGWQDEAIHQLAAMDERYGAAVSARDFAAPPDELGCSCRLYTDGTLAQIDEVGTVEARRGRGYARAAVLAAADAAAADGCDPIFLLTDAADWPQRLYERLGFDAIGSVYEFLKLSIDTPPGSRRRS